MRPTHILVFVLMFCCVNGVSLHARGADEVVCVKATESPLDPIFKYVESIANKTGLTTTSIPYKNIHAIIVKWKKGQTNITIKTLVKIAYFLGTNPATLLKLGRDMTTSFVAINEVNIKQVLNAGEPLSVDMLKYLDSMNELPKWYADYLKERMPLSDDSMASILGHIQTKFREHVLELQEQTSRLLGHDISLRSLSQTLGLNSGERIIYSTIYYHHLPTFNIFVDILKASNTDVITFFEAVQADDKFQIPFRSVQTGSDQNLNSRQQEIMRTMGGRIQWAMDSRRFSSNQTFRYLIGTNKIRLSYGKQDVYLSSFVNTSFATEIPLSVLIDSSQSLDNYVKKYPRSGRSKEEIRAEKVSGDYITRFRQAFKHFIIWKMQELNISLFQLARNSYLNIQTIRTLIIDDHLPNYLTLLRLVQDGFGQSMVDFFQEFERFVEALHHPLFEGSNPYFRFEQAIKNYDLDQSVASREDLMNFGAKSEVVENALRLAYDRVSSLDNNTTRNRTGVRINDWNSDNLSKVKVKSLIRLAHFFGITLFQLLSPQTLSELIRSENFTSDELDQYTPPSDENVQLALNRLSENIQRQRGYNISDQDLLIRSSLDRLEILNPILHGESTASVGRLFQVAEALAWTTSLAPSEAQTSVIHTPPSQDEFYNMLKLLLEGVDIPTN